MLKQLMQRWKMSTAQQVAYSALPVYVKYCPNVFLAKCSEPHESGEVIEVQGKYNAHECLVHNLVMEKGGFWYYSITREDGFNAQERARRKAERLNGYAANAEKRSNAAYEASKEGAEFLSLGEPIKIGHHSERKHRALFERNHNRMAKCVEESNKAEDYARRAAYWEAKEATINLSMPESIGFYEHKLEKATAYHVGLKDGSIEKRHSMSMQYANKAVKEAKNNLETAILLWGER
jgi:hypothetical protein